MNTFKYSASVLSSLLALVLLQQPVQAGEPVTVTLHTEQERPEINPFIYGQFIEHLGRCIYGGIWAEMLEDRKFYFPITEDYEPYKELTDSPFPVVGASPWQIVGDASGVTMVAADSFVGKHTPRITPGSGIRQRDLGLVRDKEYVGYIWLKGADRTAGPVETVLVWGGDPAQRQKHAIKKVSSEYKKYSFKFTAGMRTDSAMLEVRVLGDQSVFVGTLSLMPADNVRGMRADTLALLKKLDAPMYRWPGGNFVSGYDWRDGIGPRDRRPPRKNPAWTGVEHNDMGLDEFLDFCGELGAEPLIAVNTGFGDAYSAAQEVEYCNGSTQTVGGSQRAKNGRSKPYNVKYWCVGNEMFGPWQLGFMQLGHYVQKHNRFAEAMLKIDPEIKLIGVGNLGGFNAKHDPDQKVGWSEGMLQHCAESMDYISEHFYRGRRPWNEEKPDVLGHVALLRKSVREKAEGHRKLQERLGLLPEKKVPIAMDEWNYWHRKYLYGELGCVYDLADALGVAAGLHEYFRNTDIIQMAHYAQTVNVIGCVKTTKTDAFLATTALPLMLYRHHFGSRPIKVTGDHEVQNLDIAAAITKDGKALTVGVVNPNEQSSAVRLHVEGLDAEKTGKQWVVTGDDPRAFNDAENSHVQPRVTNVTVESEWIVPGYSFAILRLETKQK